MQLIRGEIGQAFRAHQQPIQDAHRIEQQTGIRRRMNRHRHHGDIHPHHARGLQCARDVTRDERVIQRRQRRRAHAAERGRERRFRGRDAQYPEPAKRAIRGRIYQMKREVRTRPSGQLAHDENAHNNGRLVELVGAR